MVAEKDSKKAKEIKKKKRGCLPLLLAACLIVAAIVIGFVWLSSPAALVPSRDDALAAGLTADSDKLYFLLVGSDKNEAVSDSSRADTIIVAAVDVVQKQVFLVSVPRDSYVPIEGYGEDKINHAYAYGGIDLLSDTVENLFGIPIDYYAVVDFSGFEDIIDALGGVEIDVDKRMYYQTYDDLIDIEAGQQRLNGEQALQYVRYRSDAMGDITRVSRQQLLLKAIFTEFSENSGISKLPQILPAVNRAVETDLPFTDMLHLAFFFRSLSGEDLSSITLSGDFMTKNGISYWQIDEEALQEVVTSHFGGGSWCQS